jgi:xylan 1,4-beta-xylosidase
MKYKNPVIPGFYPDPSICRVDKEYYLVNSSFEYFPGVPLFRSGDLVNWEQIGYCLTRESQLSLKKTKSSDGIFAPTIRYNDGRFYLITTNWPEQGNFFVHTDDINGEWSDPVFIKQGGIDPSLFFDEGNVYMMSTGDGGIQQSLIDIRTGKSVSKPKIIWSGTGGRFAEGPHMYKIKGWYYLMIAEGGTEYGHMETIARSMSPWGPFEACPFNPILTHRDRGRHSIQSTGHADLVEAHDGSWWMVFLGVRPVGYPPCHHIGRETFLAPVKWNAEGWPVVGNNGTVETVMNTSLHKKKSIIRNTERDDFESSCLDMSWNFIRKDDPSCWSLTERPGHLRLCGSKIDLDDITGSPAFVGRRQTAFDMTASAMLEFDPKLEKEEAGMTLRMNDRHHYEIAVTRTGGKKMIFVRRRIGDMTAITAKEKLDTKKVCLIVKADKDDYSFYYKTSGGKIKFLATAKTRYISTEVAGGFMGVMIGLYATGNGKKCESPADFDWFEYRIK